MPTQDSFLTGANIDFLDGLYARWLEDPNSVEPSFGEFFARSGAPRPTGQDANRGGNGYPQVTNGGPVRTLTVETPNVSAAGMALQARVDQTLYAFRLRGHLLAQLDPLGRPRPPLEHAADLAMVTDQAFTPAELDQVVDGSGVFAGERRVRLRELLDRLRRTYCAHIGVEFMTLLDSDRRRWLIPRMEHTENRDTLSAVEQRHILEMLTVAETFESFIHTKYQGAKRFSIDGGESLIPMLETLLEVGGELGVTEVVIGMAHRGRLNVLANILGKSPDQIFSEFNGPSDPKSYVSRGDVKYHMGFSSDFTTSRDKRIHLSLAFNPSHLEFVHPVVEGRVRAKQTRLGTADRRLKALPLVIHGDAAMAAQGVVAETLNLSRLRGYDTGGTVHLVINNQLGYTTLPEDGRSTIYCTAMAQMLDIPIFHVNGDDPEACVHVMRLATEYRQQFQSDVVVDLVCFRRYGHNEGDEPGYTQPLMYAEIRQHPPVATLYAEDLEKKGRVSAKDAEAIRSSAKERFQSAYLRAKEKPLISDPSANEGVWTPFRGGSEKGVPEVSTAISLERASSLLTHLSKVPEGFTPLRQLGKILDRRLQMAKGELPLDWGSAESLAYASLLTEKVHVRLTGQDTERGTFGHRNAVLHDILTGATYTPLSAIAPNQALFEVFNSPLSEMGCMGFEFGYSLDYPDALVLWEAQFGDFANGAQVIIDQFIVAAEQKWRRLSGLVLLLPHGYEGAGPEHSSARLERFLDMSAEDNIQVCYPTTAGQLFHLLRRQALRSWRKPLVVMTPKSLLRREEAASPLSTFTDGGWQRIIGDGAEVDPSRVTRLLLCSGKVAFDLMAKRTASKDDSVAVARVEQLYPVPKSELEALVKRYASLRELYWVQEEPSNMGAWRFMRSHLVALAATAAQPVKVHYVGRVESPSPATGFLKTHELEQHVLVEEAFARGTA